MSSIYGGGAMSFLSGLPDLAINLVVAVIALLALSIISLVFPAIGLFVFGIIFLLSAFFFKDIYLDSGKNVSVAAIMVVLGVGIILFNLLAIGLHLYSVVLSSTTMSVVGMSTVSAEVSSSVIPILLIIVGSAVAATLFVREFSKKKRKKKKRGR